MTNSEKIFYDRGYGRFPYIIIKETFGVYRQVPILQLQDLSTNLEGVYLGKNEFDSEQDHEKECLKLLVKVLENTPLIIKKSMIKKENRIIIGGTPNKTEGCLVLSKDHGIYGAKIQDQKLKLERFESIPHGGQLISLSDEEMKFTYDNHYIN